MNETEKLIRKALGYAGTHANLAKDLGVTRQMVTRWSSGGGMSLDHFLRIKTYVEKRDRK